MLGLLTAISVGFSAVVLAQAQTIAPGPAAPGGPNPYGIVPGGIRVAPGSGGRSISPFSVTPEGTSVRREVRRHSVKRPRVLNAGIAFAPTEASAAGGAATTAGLIPAPTICGRHRTTRAVRGGVFTPTMFAGGGGHLTPADISP
jgi:hypothetical protein